jgi:hypothetical protein
VRLVDGNQPFVVQRIVKPRADVAERTQNGRGGQPLRSELAEKKDGVVFADGAIDEADQQEQRVDIKKRCDVGNIQRHPLNIHPHARDDRERKKQQPDHPVYSEQLPWQRFFHFVGL